MINFLAHSAQLMEDYQFERHFKLIDTSTMIPVADKSTFKSLPVMDLYQCELPHANIELEHIKCPDKRSWLALLCGVTPVSILTAGILKPIIYKGKYITNLTTSKIKRL